MLNFKKTSRAIVVITILSAAALIVGFAVNRAADKPLVEMKIVYEENPAFFFKDMRLVWDDAVYYEKSAEHIERGAEIGYASDGLGVWRIYELKGYGRDHLLAVESDDVWRVMSVYPPEEPFRRYILENADERQRAEKMLSVTLYNDGTALLSTPPVSSYYLAAPYYYIFTDDELIIRYERDNLIARFESDGDDILIFKEAYVPLFADEGARYVSVSINNGASPDIHSGVAEIIDRNLGVITSSPSYASSIAPYIREHQSEYDEIVALGDSALAHMIALFEEGGRTDLRGWIMAFAIRDILGGDDIFKPSAAETGQEWYDENKELIHDMRPHVFAK